MATNRKSKRTVLARAKVRYDAFVVIEQDLELIKKAIPSDLDGLAASLLSIGCGLMIALLTCEMRELTQGIFGTFAGISGIATVIRISKIRKRKSEIVALIDRIRENPCNFDQHGAVS